MKTGSTVPIKSCMFIDNNKKLRIIEIYKKREKNLYEALDENKVTIMSVIDYLIQAIKLRHSSGVIHRDIKLWNILVDENGKVSLADHGLAVKENTTDACGRAGTKYYMAPEIENYGKATTKSDIYSLGITFRDIFELFSDNFFPKDISDSTDEQTQEKIKEIKAKFSKLIENMIKNKPNERFDIEEVEEQWEEIKDFIYKSFPEKNKEDFLFLDKLNESQNSQDLEEKQEKSEEQIKKEKIIRDKVLYTSKVFNKDTIETATNKLKNSLNKVLNNESLPKGVKDCIDILNKCIDENNNVRLPNKDFYDLYSKLETGTKEYYIVMDKLIKIRELKLAIEIRRLEKIKNKKIKNNEDLKEVENEIKLFKELRINIAKITKNSKDNNIYGYLFTIAVEKNKIDTIQYLIDKKYNINLDDNKIVDCILKISENHDNEFSNKIMDFLLDRAKDREKVINKTFKEILENRRINSIIHILNKEEKLKLSDIDVQYTIAETICEDNQKTSRQLIDVLIKNKSEDKKGTILKIFEESIKQNRKDVLEYLVEEKKIKLSVEDTTMCISNALSCKNENFNELFDFLTTKMEIDKNLVVNKIIEETINSCSPYKLDNLINNKLMELDEKRINECIDAIFSSMNRIDRDIFIRVLLDKVDNKEEIVNQIFERALNVGKLNIIEYLIRNNYLKLDCKDIIDNRLVELNKKRIDKCVDAIFVNKAKEYYNGYIEVLLSRVDNREEIINRIFNRAIDVDKLIIINYLIGSGKIKLSYEKIDEIINNLNTQNNKEDIVDYFLNMKNEINQIIDSIFRKNNSYNTINDLFNALFNKITENKENIINQILDRSIKENRLNVIDYILNKEKRNIKLDDKTIEYFINNIVFSNKENRLEFLILSSLFYIIYNENNIEKYEIFVNKIFDKSVENNRVDILNMMFKREYIKTTDKEKVKKFIDIICNNKDINLEFIENILDKYSTQEEKEVMLIKIFDKSIENNNPRILEALLSDEKTKKIIDQKIGNNYNNYIKNAIKSDCKDLAKVLIKNVFYSNIEKLKNNQQELKKSVIDNSLIEIKENLKSFCEKFEINKIELDEFNKKLDNIGKNEIFESKKYERLIGDFNSLLRLDYQNEYLK